MCVWVYIFSTSFGYYDIIKTICTKPELFKYLKTTMCTKYKFPSTCTRVQILKYEYWFSSIHMYSSSSLRVRALKYKRKSKKTNLGTQIFQAWP